jgi:hypothetical protein
MIEQEKAPHFDGPESSNSFLSGQTQHKHETSLVVPQLKEEISQDSIFMAQEM